MPRLVNGLFIGSGTISFTMSIPGKKITQGAFGLPWMKWKLPWICLSSQGTSTRSIG